MNLFRLFALWALCAVAAGAAHAHGYTVGPIKIGHPYARATAPGQTTGGAYLSLDNQGAADRLVSVQADVAERVELHTMSMDGNVMRMRQVPAVDLPAGQRVELKPGSLHIMLVHLKAPLKVGDSFPMTLTFEQAGPVTVDVKVQAAAGAPGGGHHHHGMKH